MKLFLDTSVLLAASGSASGASRAVIDLAQPNKWLLISSPYCIAETTANIRKLSASAPPIWRSRIRSRLQVVADSIVFDKPLAFQKAKDKPVLITALASGCNYLLTLDRVDFALFMSAPVYGLRVHTPAMFLETMRAHGRLVE